MSGMDEVMGVIKILEAGEGAQIGAAASAGDELAISVIRMYEFMRICPGDPGGQMLFLIAYEEWIKANGGLSGAI